MENKRSLDKRQKDLSLIYSKIKSKIEKRLREFKEISKSSNHDIFCELVFCLLTPQSRAKICWQAVLNLKRKNLLLKENKEEILKELKGVRFKNKKAQYIIEARRFYNIKEILKNLKDVFEMREWLCKNIKGIGYKEASHFLRNIGFYEDVAILDRHILKNLKKLKVIEEIPKNLTKKNYLEIENKMKKFAKEIGIPLPHLDFVLWYKETGEIFK